MRDCHVTDVTYLDPVLDEYSSLRMSHMALDMVMTFSLMAVRIDNEGKLRDAQIEIYVKY